MQDDTSTSPQATVTWETNTWTGSGAGRFNEDYAFVDPLSCGAALVDGATGLTKVNLVASESDAAWYARNLSTTIVCQMAQGSAAGQALLEAGQKVAVDYLLFEGAEDLARIDMPNGSVAIVNWTDASLTVVMLGDCTAVVGLRDGTCEVIYDDTLSQLDNQNYERMFAWATAHDATMAQARRALNPRFIENRLKMNEPGGYWAADVSCRGLKHATTTLFDRADVAWVFACTDGYANAVDIGVVPDFESMARLVEQGGGVELGERLRAAEEEDAGCWRVHRSKTSDDATYLFVRL